MNATLSKIIKHLSLEQKFVGNHILVKLDKRHKFKDNKPRGFVLVSCVSVINLYSYKIKIISQSTL